MYSIEPSAHGVDPWIHPILPHFGLIPRARARILYRVQQNSPSHMCQIRGSGPLWGSPRPHPGTSGGPPDPRRATWQGLWGLMPHMPCTPAPCASAPWGIPSSHAPQLHVAFSTMPSVPWCIPSAHMPRAICARAHIPCSYAPRPYVPVPHIQWYPVIRGGIRGPRGVHIVSVPMSRSVRAHMRTPSGLPIPHIQWPTPYPMSPFPVRRCPDPVLICSVA